MMEKFVNSKWFYPVTFVVGLLFGYFVVGPLLLS